MKSGHLILIFSLMLALTACKKSDDRKNIVILSPYDPKTQIWQHFVETAREEFADTSRYNLHFYYVFQYIGQYWDKREYERDVRYPFSRALVRVKNSGVKPDLFILHGDDIAHAAVRMDDPLLKDTPLLCTGIVHPHWKGLLAMKSNAVVMESRPEVKKNLDFIRDMGFSNYVVTVMDSTYIDDRIRECILEEIGNDSQHYRPNLYLEQEDRIHRKTQRDPRITLLPVSTMWPEKNDRHPGAPGRFEFKWIFHSQQQETSFLHLKNDDYANQALSYNVGPFFTMTPEHFNLPLTNALSYCIGGYFTPYPSMWKQVHPVVDKLLSGTAPRQIPWGILEKDYWLDWRLVRSIHPYAEDFPKGVKFVNLPWREKSRAVNLLLYGSIVILFVLFIVLAVIIPSVLSHRQKKQRRILVKKGQEAQNTQKQVEYILSELNAYIWWMHPDRTITLSPSFYRDFGMENGLRLDAETLIGHILKPDWKCLRKMLDRDDQDGESDMEMLVKVPGSDVPRAIMMHTVSLSEKDDCSGFRLKAGFFYFNDEAYKRNEELRQAYRRSEEVAEKESFLASMNERFNNPVDKIIFFSNMLATHFHELTDEQKADCEQKVMSNNQKLMDLLDEVMGDTIQTRNCDRIELSTHRVADLMDEIYISCSVTHRDDVNLEFSPGPDGSCIEANRSVFIQVMNALVKNAFSSCKGSITIGWTETDADEVTIFIDNSSTDISNCEKMVNSIGGTISVLNLQESGSRTEISFPVLPPPIPENQ